MRDASPPPAPPQQPVVSDDSGELLPAPLLPGQVEALETVGICMLVEYMLAPPGAEEPQQLRAFWPDASAATPVPAQNTEVLHDFMFRLFATCMYTPECSVLAFISVWKSTSVSRAPDNSSLSHFSAMTWPRWLRRAVRSRHRHAIKQASRRWRGGTRRKILISTQVRARRVGGGGRPGRVRRLACGQAECDEFLRAGARRERYSRPRRHGRVRAARPSRAVWKAKFYDLHAIDATPAR
jgi:hypothetical protein